MDSLQPDDKLLVAIGNMFATVGMGQQAVEAYTKVLIHSFNSEICLKGVGIQTNKLQGPELYFIGALKTYVLKISRTSLNFVIICPYSNLK